MEIDKKQHIAVAMEANKQVGAGGGGGGGGGQGRTPTGPTYCRSWSAEAHQRQYSIHDAYARPKTFDTTKQSILHASWVSRRRDKDH